MLVYRHSTWTRAFYRTSFCLCSSQGSRNYKWKQFLNLFFTADTSRCQPRSVRHIQQEYKMSTCSVPIFIQVLLLPSSFLKEGGYIESRCVILTALMMVQDLPTSNNKQTRHFNSSACFWCFVRGLHHTHPSMFLCTYILVLFAFFYFSFTLLGFAGFDIPYLGHRVHSTLKS